MRAKFETRNFHGRLTRRCPWNWTHAARDFIPASPPFVIELYWSRPAAPVSSVLNLESCVRRCRWWPILKLPAAAAFPLDPCPTVITSLLIRLRDTDRRASRIFSRYDRNKSVYTGFCDVIVKKLDMKNVITCIYAFRYREIDTNVLHTTMEKV